ncbi:MAG TPA: DUF1398 family protein [Bdellovibrionales bacterium]|nr:DUF1398 family protein [Bdellovibrionales bacterium]
MNRSVIKETVKASLSSTMTFPQIVGMLVAEGVESYHVDLVRHENRYYSKTGESHVEEVSLAHPTAAKEFSGAKVEAAVRSSQAGKITYRQFIDLISEAGTTYYIAYLNGKRVTYFGRNGDSHTEYFPGFITDRPRSGS